MRTSVISPCKELKQKLLAVGILVDGFQQKKTSAIDEWVCWLRETEEILKKYNFREASELAGLRAEILAASKFESNPRNRRKAQIQKALETVNVAQNIVGRRQGQLEEKIEHVRAVIKQITTIAKQAGYINFKQGDNFAFFLEKFIADMQQHSQLKPSINGAIATIGKYDTLRILAEEIELD
jgi:hypothetical protein